MDFFRFVFVPRRAKFCKNFCIYQMTNAKSLQSDCTAYSISKPKLKLLKDFVNLSP